MCRRTRGHVAVASPAKPVAADTILTCPTQVRPIVHDEAQLHLFLRAGSDLEGFTLREATTGADGVRLPR
jgi:hypothetical protein